MNLLKKLFLLSLFFGVATVSNANTKERAVDFTKRQEVRKFIGRLCREDGFNEQELNRLFCRIEIHKSSLKYYTPAKKIKPKKKRKSKATKKKRKARQGSWTLYERKLLNKNRVSGGVAFMMEHRDTLAKAEKIYGVPPEYITAVIGIESHYGRYAGKYPVLDTLATLAFEKNRRNRFFKNELREYLKMTRREELDPKDVNGSFAGAIGLGQFMPSNFEKLGIDFDKDGKVRICQPSDAIGSIANYFKQSGWRRGEPVATRVSYKGMRFKRLKTGYKHKYYRKNLKGIYPKKRFRYNAPVRLIKLDRSRYDELWYGTRNFYVITRYNHSSYYAMAVHQLAQKIKKETALAAKNRYDYVASVK